MPYPQAAEPVELAAARIVHRLGGRWYSQGGMCHCPAHHDRTPSLSVRVGSRSILFKCFAGCPTDVVLRAIRGLDLAVPIDTPSRRLPFDAVSSRMADLARSLWDGGQDLRGTPGEAYLRCRGLACFPDALRWHSHTPLGRGRGVRFRPAIIAAVQDEDRIVAVQRLFIDPRHSTLARDLPAAKLTLGRLGCGAVRLNSSTKRLLLAEGIENAASASVLLKVPGWATLGSGRLHRIRIPSGVEELLLCPDNDHAGRIAEARARATYETQGLTVSTIWPWRGHNDWNDVLQEEGGRWRVR